MVMMKMMMMVVEVVSQKTTRIPDLKWGRRLLLSSSFFPSAHIESRTFCIPHHHVMLQITVEFMEMKDDK